MTQRETVLRELSKAGKAGVSARTLNYEFGITRSAAVVFELRAEGYDIETIDLGLLPDGRRAMAKYVLKTKSQPMFAETHFASAPTGKLALDCGCVRTADGLTWETSCARHAR